MRIRKIHLLYTILLFISFSCSPVRFTAKQKDDSATGLGVTPTPGPGTGSTPNPTSTPGSTPNPTSTPGSTPNPTSTPGPTSIVIDVPLSNNQVDILIVVDDSTSMAVDNTKLAERLSGFVTALGAASIDWQMCITTTDVKYYEGRPAEWSIPNSHVVVLNKTYSSLYSIFKNTIAALGSGWSNDEQGIKASILSIFADPNYHCYRRDAALSVIIISDEDERSVGGNQSLSSSQYQPLGPFNQSSEFVKSVRNVFGPEKKMVVNSIVVPVESCMAYNSATKTNTTCKEAQDSQGSKSFIGTKYIELSNLTGGRSTCICESDYSVNLNYFKESILKTLATFDLPCTAKTDVYTIKVNTADVLVSISGNRVYFNPVLPSGSSVTIRYQCLQ